jgi:hypothetical protein
MSTLVEFADIVFILKYLKNLTNENHDEVTAAATRRIQAVFEANHKLQHKIREYLNMKNHHASINDFPFIRDIIFRYYNPYLLHNIDCLRFLSQTLSRREDRTTEYFIVWFQSFLCESQPDWLNYQELLNQWTECFVHEREMFPKIIGQADMLIELWTKVAPDNEKRSSLFVTHMVTQCFRQGKKIAYCFYFKLDIFIVYMLHNV